MEDNNKNFNQKKIINASIVVLFLMLIFGLSHRIIADKLLFSGDLIPIDPNALAKFPMDINEWTGKEMPLDDVIIEATDTDAHISRNYSRNNGLDSVSFYVAFGQRARDLMPHRPEVCYIGNGYTHNYSEEKDLPLEDGVMLPCTIMQFSKAGFNQKKTIIVLDYYIVDGEISRDVRSLRSQIWKGSGAVKYTAQIQISVPIQSIQDSEKAKETISQFAVESAPLLRELLASFNIEESEPEQHLEPNDVSLDAESD